MINQKELFDAARKFVQFCKNSGKSVEMEALEELKETNPTLALKMLSEAMFHIERAPPSYPERKKLLIFSTIFKTRARSSWSQVGGSWQISGFHMR